MRKSRQTLAALGMTLAAAAAAQSNPWYVGATQTLGHDDNIYRLPAASAVSSGTISTTQLVGGLDLRPGRQHLSASAQVGHNRYSAQPQLDFNGYALDAALDWETAAHVSGRVELGANRRLGSFTSFTTPTGIGRNVEQTRHASALFRLGDARRSRLWFEAELNHDLRRSDIDLGSARPLLGEPVVLGYERDFTTTGVSFGGRYRVGGALVLGLGLHATRGDEDYRLRTPASAAVAREDSFDRHDIDFIANWSPGGDSRVHARLSRGRTDVEHHLFMRDRSGWSGLLRWEWTPTAKLATDLRLARETNARSISGSTETANEPVTSLELKARYALSAKVGASAALRHASRRLDTGVPTDGTDRRRGFDLGLEWAALRNLSLGCSIGHETRSVGSLSAGYEATSTLCTARAVLQ